MNLSTAVEPELKAIAERLAADHAKMADVYEIDFPSDGKIEEPAIEMNTGARTSPCGSSSAARFNRRRGVICVTLAPVKRATLPSCAGALRRSVLVGATRPAPRLRHRRGRQRHADPQPRRGGIRAARERRQPRDRARTRFGGPLRIALVVDSSGAVAPLLNNLRAGLTTFLDELPGEHEITFISTGGQIRIRQPITTDRKKLKTAVGLFASDGGANSLIETMMEVDRRFLNGAPGQWPVFVIVTTDQGATRWEPNYDRFNRFVTDFVSRGGTAHAIVIHGKAGGITTEFVMNVVENSGGYYESMAIANVLPDKMKMVAEHMDANYKAMSNWYEVEFVGDGRGQAPRVQVGTKRSGVTLKLSTRRPF